MKTLTKEQILQIPKLRVKGQTNKQIGETLKVSERQVGYWVKKLREAGHEIPRKNKGGPKAISL